MRQLAPLYHPENFKNCYIIIIFEQISRSHTNSLSANSSQVLVQHETAVALQQPHYLVPHSSESVCGRGAGMGAH